MSTRKKGGAMHYYQFNIGDYAKHTQHLTVLEHLAYRLLLDRYYLNEEPLELDVKKLARLVGMSQYQQEVEQVLEDFFIKTKDGYLNTRCEKEIASYKAKADSARANGKKGGRPKKTQQEPKKTQSVNLANPDITGSEANHKPLTINQEPLTNNQETSLKDIVTQAPPSRDEANEIFKFWQLTMNRTRTKLTPERRKVINARIKDGYSVDEIKTAIHGCAKTPWNMGVNPSGKFYDDLTLICRNGSKLEEFIRSNSSVSQSEINNREADEWANGYESNNNGNTYEHESF